MDGEKIGEIMKRWKSRLYSVGEYNKENGK